MKTFYTAKEAQERLGMNNNHFHYLVRKGTVKGVVLPGRKHSVYPRSDIDKLAAALVSLIEQYDKDVSVFQVATQEDMQEEFQMDVSLFGKKTATLEQRIERLEHNPESDYVLKNEGEIVGHISFFPLSQEDMKLFLDGKIADPELPSKVLPFVSGEDLDILILVMGVKPGFPPDVASHYGQRLIAGTIQVFRILGERGVKINNIRATSRTPTGIRLCRKLKMNEEPVPGESARLRFTLNAQTSDSPLIKGYQEGYSEYRKIKEK
ncbi:MAG: helix-turn-helix domain-containing protein [Ktedonobacteraceae bacterium]|nr:helix-turn-helix domain-containing protein [Ktedonobacteraceae bacterium]